jgi:hypothetical protein
MFYRLVHTLVAQDIPHTFLLFPRFACDADYAHARLRPLLGRIPEETFREAFARVSNPGLIHDFSKPKAHEAGAAEKQYRQNRAKMKRHRVRRTLRWTLVCASALMLLIYLVRHKPYPGGAFLPAATALLR